MQVIKSILVFVAMAQLGCAAGKSANAPKPRYQSNIITSKEIGLTTANQAYDLIRMLRPQWLHGRGYKSFQSPADVYVNEIRYGDIESLSSITTEMIKEIHFLSVSEATVRFGSNHPSGVILITI